MSQPTPHVFHYVAAEEPGIGDVEIAIGERILIGLNIDHPWIDVSANHVVIHEMTACDMWNKDDTIPIVVDFGHAEMKRLICLQGIVSPRQRVDAHSAFIEYRHRSLNIGHGIENDHTLGNAIQSRFQSLGVFLHVFFGDEIANAIGSDHLLALFLGHAML